MLSEPLEQLDFGPFTHPPSITWHGPWFKKMLDDLDKSLKAFKDRRILVISWLLTIGIGIFGNLASSALLDGFGPPRWDLAAAFLMVTGIFGLILLWYFPPRFEHLIQVWYGQEASNANLELFKRFKFLGPSGDSPIERKLDDFMRIYNALMVRDELGKMKPSVIRIRDATYAPDGYELWLTVELRERFAWLSRKIEDKIASETGHLCQRCATTIMPFAWIDEKTSEESLSQFNDALKRLNLKALKEKIRKQILEIKEWQ